MPVRAQRAHHVAEIALRLTQVVRLGEALAGQRLVGDLTRRRPARRGCRRVPSGRPLDERPARGPAPRGARCSRRSRSPFGSRTTAPMPCSIARTAIQVCVTVLPEPVAPTTSVCAPPLEPPNGIDTARRLSSTPEQQLVPAQPVRAAAVARARARSSLRASAHRRSQWPSGVGPRAPPGPRPPRDLRDASAGRARLRTAWRAAR